MCKDLVKLGIGKRKTYRLKLPKIPKKYVGDFVRGYFDGDGNIWIGFVHKNQLKKVFTIQTAFTSASNKFLEDLREVLRKRGVKGGGMYTKKNSNVHCLRFSVKDSILLYHLMYDNLVGDLFLNRKKERFEKFLKDKYGPVV